MKDIRTIDVFVFVAYFVVVMLIGFYVGRRKEESARNHFVRTGKLLGYLIGFVRKGVKRPRCIFYQITQRIRKRVKEIIGWIKTVDGSARARFVGR